MSGRKTIRGSISVQLECRENTKNTSKMGIWVPFRVCTMQLRTAIFAAASLLLLMASMIAGEDSCKFYVKIFEAKEMECEMECFLRYGQDPVCKTGVMSTGQCHIGTRHQQMCIKWPVSTPITCRNNTYSEEMKGTEQDCAKDQESLDCTKEFNSDPPNQRGEQEGDKSSAPAIKAAWVTILWALILVVINACNGAH